MSKTSLDRKLKRKDASVIKLCRASPDATPPLTDPLPSLFLILFVYIFGDRVEMVAAS